MNIYILFIIYNYKSFKTIQTIKLIFNYYYSITCKSKMIY